MIKLKKVVAIALAATMCMGLNMTASAGLAGGQGTANNPVSDLGDVASPTFVNDIQATTSGTDGHVNPDLVINKNTIAKDSKTYNSIDTKSEVENIMKENGVSLNGATVVPIVYRNITSVSKVQDNIITFTLSPSEFVKAADFDEHNSDHAKKYTTGDEVYALMETGTNTGVWELVSGKVNDDGMVDFKVDHTGTIIVIKAMKDGSIMQFTQDNNGNNVQPPVDITPDPGKPITPVTPDGNGTSTNPSNGQNAANAANAAGNTWTSPKTGEF